MEIKSNMLGDLLLEAGLIDQFQLDSALSLQRNLGGQIGAALIKLGYLPEETIHEFLEAQQLYSRVSLDELVIDSALMDLLPIERMRKLKVFPVELRRQENEKILRVAMTDPTDLRLIEDLQFSTGCRILPLLATEDDILRAIDQNGQQEPMFQETIDALKENFQGDFTQLSSDAATRLDCLLDILMEKGILSRQELERVKGG
ncbi:MAG: hypothetical protein R6V33_07855 [Pelovirga sp.]